MEDGNNAFYVVKKGDVVGIYKNLSDCQAQVGSSICDPSVSVYKGYSLSKETEDYLVSRGLKNAIHCINSVDLKENLFGKLVPCLYQQPDLVESSTKRNSPQKHACEVDMENKMDAKHISAMSTEPGRNNTRIESSHTQTSTTLSNHRPDHSTPVFKEPYKKIAKLELSSSRVNTSFSSQQSCILEFDGASKGNPGMAGAGAVLRTEDGTVICRVREGLGVVTNNVAEYRAVILGMKYALKKGFHHIRVQGDSKLVCMQIQDLWQVKNKNMIDLCKEAKELKDKFLFFHISHVLREFNSEADKQANLAINLANGEVQEES